MLRQFHVHCIHCCFDLFLLLSVLQWMAKFAWCYSLRGCHVLNELADGSGYLRLLIDPLLGRYVPQTW